MLRKLPAVAVAVLSLTFTASAVATETGAVPWPDRRR